MVEEGTIIPQDYESLAILSAFHALEVVFEVLEPATGVTPEEFTERGRYTIYFEPDFDGISQKLNASFVSPSSFVMYRRSKNEGVPIAANLPVLAHEAGHALFDRLVFDTTDPLLAAAVSQAYAFRGFNEGMADFLSFTITGSTNPLADQLIGTDDRDLRGDEYSFDDFEVGCGQSFYCLGTLLARALYRTVVRLGNAELFEGRTDVARRVFASLDSILSRVIDSPVLEDDSDLDPLAVDVGAFLEALLRPLDSELSAVLCEELDTQFGTNGFPASGRGRCP